MSYTESRYEFLDRVDSQFFGNVRELLESWYASYPDDDGHLRAGFQSKDDRSHTAAFWGALPLPRRTEPSRYK